MKKLIAMVLSISLIAGITTSAISAPKKAAPKPVKKVVKPAPKPAPRVAPAPEPAPWVPPAPKPVAPAPVAPTDLGAQALGLTAGLKAGLSTGLTGIGGSLDYSIASMIPDASVRIGGEYLVGTNPTGNASVKAVSLKVGAVYALTMLKSPDMPVDLYIGGTFVLPLKVSGGGSGWGADGFIGGKYMVPDLGVLFGEVGYSGLKYSSSAAALKGISASVGYNYSF